MTSEDAEDQISYLDERLFPLMVLTGEAEAAATEHGEEWPEGEELRRNRTTARKTCRRR
jgi:uncharacterized protein